MRWNPMVPELSVSDFDRSCGFYVDALGFVVLFERDEPRFGYLACGDAQLMLEQDHPSGWVTAPLRAPRGRGLNLQIEVEDASALRQRLLARGHSLYRELRDSWYDVGEGQEGQREFLVQDPDGYLLRLVQPLT